MLEGDRGASGGLAFAFDHMGMVALPGGPGVTQAETRAYVVLAGGEAYLLGSSGAKAFAPVLEPVPGAAHEAIAGQHPGRALRFPDDRPDRAFATPAAGPDLRWADPQKINLIHPGGDTKALARMRGAVLDGDWDTPYRRPFAQLDVYAAVQARFGAGVRWEDTAYYERCVTPLRNGTPAWGCRTEEEFRDRLDKLDRLFEDIKDNGYRTQSDLQQRNRADEVRVAIRRDGRLLFIDGRHRLAMARLLALPSIPVNVVVRHQEWMRFREELLEYIRPRGGRVYQTIDHPDLRELPAHHRTERAEILREAFSSRDVRGRRLVDIGAHWGAMTQVMTELGFECTAVELNRRLADIARRLSVATETNFAVWQGDVFELPDLERYDAVLALNVFHHFLKTEELHGQLVDFLGRLRASTIVFEPHVADPPAQMRGAYRNYPEQEFAEFVARHAGLDRIEQLGRAADGRALFMLSHPSGP